MKDEELVKSILNGHSSSFSELVIRYQGKVYGSALNYTKNPEDAKDLAQEIFLKIYNNLDKFRNDASFSTWVYRITMNACLDWSRKKKVPIAEEPDLDEGAEPLIHRIPDRAGSTEDQFLKKSTSGDVQEAVEGLPEKYGVPIRLYYFQGLAVSEISDYMGLPKRTVETRLYRAKELLRNGLAHYKPGGEAHGAS